MTGWSDVGLWVAVCFLAKISVHIYNLVCTSDTVTGNLAVNSVFITFRSMRETKNFAFSFFKTHFYTKLPFPLPWWSKDLLVDKHAGGGQATSKSTCADPAWSLTAWFGDRPASGMSKLSASVNSDLRNGSFWLEFRDAEHVDRCTDWCSEIGSLTSLDACNSGATRDRRRPISLHQSVVEIHAWEACASFDRINWPLTSEMFTFLDMRVSVPRYGRRGLVMTRSVARGPQKKKMHADCSAG